MITTDNFVSIHPSALSDFTSRLSALAQAIKAGDITAGPADDAERDGLPIRVVNGVAVIPLMGFMVRRAGYFARLFGFSGTDDVRHAIQVALADEDISNILLRVDSPGGSVCGLPEIADVIHSADKPIITQVEGTCASAAYYVASQTDRILIGRGDLVGSIGVRMLMYDYSKAFEEAGIKAIPIDTGKYKSAGAIGTEITEEHIADFQRIVDFYFDDFVAMVTRGRGISEDTVRAVGDGRMYTPAEAAGNGLIDGVSTIEETLNELRNSARVGRSTQSARARIAI